MKALEKQTNDPVLKVIQSLANFVRSLGKDSPQKETFNNLRRLQQEERFAQLDVPVKIALPPSKIPQYVFGNISSEYRKLVDSFAREIPIKMQDILAQKGVKIAMYESPSYLPESLTSQHARGHLKEHSNANLPEFYERRTGTLVFVENPVLAPDEQKAKEQLSSLEKHQKNTVVNWSQNSKFEKKRFAPTEENAWHELGHAFDLAVCKLTNNPGFDATFRHELMLLNPKEQKELSYFVSPDPSALEQQKLEKPKQETFAQLFKLIVTKEADANIRDILLIKKFPQTRKLIQKELAPYL